MVAELAGAGNPAIFITGAGGAFRRILAFFTRRPERRSLPIPPPPRQCCARCRARHHLLMRGNVVLGERGGPQAPGIKSRKSPLRRPAPHSCCDFCGPTLKVFFMSGAYPGFTDGLIRSPGLGDASELSDGTGTSYLAPYTIRWELHLSWGFHRRVYGAN